MDDLTLWHVPQSRSLRVLWLLEEIGCPYTLVALDHRGLHDALHPDRVPALRDGKTTIHETGAMTEWLCETRAPHLWRAPGDAGRMAWLDWLHFGETLGQHVAALDQSRASQALSVERLEADRLTQTLALLEDWLHQSDWLLSEFSGVDCQVGYSVWAAAHLLGLEGRPALAAYRDRCTARPAFRRALATG
ncbi:glutathione S-transferase family protein [Falsirhodobacter deserti]|uniref:glutathione S-transferase family protein n=1 Tax=Falsirhodobacter deserti TaxID=1365611 RepID=UPI000FE41E0B|nr:glutathione S-transferase family protein [Falsirhodobacter deserti]